MAEKKVIDWEKIELDYRAGIKSLRQIAGEHDIAESGIRRRAKQYEWVRDLSEKIKAKADDIVRKESVRSNVRTKTTISEKETIDLLSSSSTLQFMAGSEERPVSIP